MKHLIHRPLFVLVAILLATIAIAIAFKMLCVSDSNYRRVMIAANKLMSSQEFNQLDYSLFVDSCIADGVLLAFDGEDTCEGSDAIICLWNTGKVLCINRRGMVTSFSLAYFGVSGIKVHRCIFQSNCTSNGKVPVVDESSMNHGKSGNGTGKVPLHETIICVKSGRNLRCPIFLERVLPCNLVFRGLCVSRSA